MASCSRTGAVQPERSRFSYLPVVGRGAKREKEESSFLIPDRVVVDTDISVEEMGASELSRVSSAEEGRYYLLESLLVLDTEGFFTRSIRPIGLQQVKDIDTPNTFMWLIAAFPALFLLDDVSDTHCLPGCCLDFPQFVRFFAFPILSGVQHSTEWMESCCMFCPAILGAMRVIQLLRCGIDGSWLDGRGEPPRRPELQATQGHTDRASTIPAKLVLVCEL